MSKKNNSNTKARTHQPEGKVSDTRKVAVQETASATRVVCPSAQLGADELRNAIFWSEIIAKPKYLESRDRRKRAAVESGDVPEHDSSQGN